MDYKIYLAKDGKTHGPFTAEEFEEIRLSGRITEYDSIFDSRAGSTWQPLELPPAPAPAATKAHHPTAHPSAAKASEPSVPAASSTPARSASLPIRPVEAVCHNFRSVTAGRLVHVSETGCDLVVSNFREAGPCFAERGQVLLNLLDPSTGKSMDVAARLIAITRAPDGGWTYRLEWRGCPEILLAG